MRKSQHLAWATIVALVSGAGFLAFGIAASGTATAAPLHRCTITGTAKADVLRGTPGNDVICGLGGNDKIYGNGGNDILIGGPGADLLVGGAGNDTVSYEDKTLGVVADLSGSKNNDGTKGEKDTIAADVENLTGGAGNDTLTGNGGNNVLVGLAGSDIFNGGAGNDTVSYAEKMADVIASIGVGNGDDGTAGEKDTVNADIENLIGGPGNDTLTLSLIHI